MIRKASKSFKKINVKQDTTSTPDDYDEEREVLKMTFSQNPFNTMINKKHLSIDSPGLFLILNYIVFYKFYMKIKSWFFLKMLSKKKSKQCWKNELKFCGKLQWQKLAKMIPMQRKMILKKLSQLIRLKNDKMWKKYI